MQHNATYQEVAKVICIPWDQLSTQADSVTIADKVFHSKTELGIRRQAIPGVCWTVVSGIVFGFSFASFCLFFLLGLHVNQHFTYIFCILEKKKERGQQNTA